MKKAILLAIPLMLAGCASLDTMRLREDMTKQEVQNLFKNPTQTHFSRVGGNKIEVWDYTKSSWMMKQARLWFLNDKLKLWQSCQKIGPAIVSPLDKPPDFESTSAPDFILEIRNKDITKKP